MGGNESKEGYWERRNPKSLELSAEEEEMFAERRKQATLDYCLRKAVQKYGGHYRHAERMRDSVNELIKNGADPLCVDGWKNTILHFLSERLESSGGYTDVEAPEEVMETMKIILKAGCDVNARQAHGKTPLHIVARSGCLPVTEFLLNHRATVLARDANGRTPLHEAVDSRNLNVVRILVQRGAEVYAKDYEGDSPLDNAKKISDGVVQTQLVEALCSAKQLRVPSLQMLCVNRILDGVEWKHMLPSAIAVLVKQSMGYGYQEGDIMDSTR